MSQSLKQSAADELLELADALCELDSEFRVVRVNAAQERFVKVPRSQTLGRSHWELWPDTAEPDSKIWREYHRCMRERVSVHFDEYRLGHWIHIEAHPTPVGGIVIFFRDVTEARRAQLEQYRLANQRQHALDAAQMGWWSLDVEHGVTEVDERYAELFGMTGRSITVEQFRAAVHPEDLALVEAGVFASLDPRRRALYDLEYRVVRADGEVRWVHSSGIAQFTAGPPERATRMTGTMKDVTDRKTAELALRRSEAQTREAVQALERALETTRATEERLRQSQKMEAVGRLAGGVAHDFNNLLTVILSGAELLAHGLPENEPLREDALEIRTAGERAAALTRQLLAFSRLQVLEPRVVDVNQLVLGLEKMLRRLIGEDVELSLNLAPRVHACLLDPGQFEQALMNLVVNARDAMPDGGRLVIETTNVTLEERAAAELHEAKPGPYVRVSVSDTGVGMSGELQSRIFEPFFTTKERGSGTGLGLSTVYGIVQQSGGCVGVVSAPGQGSTFRLFFPRSEQQVSLPESSPSPAPVTGGRETVLLVEDDELVRGAVHAMLRRGGYSVLAAANAGEALLICEDLERPIDLLLTDVVMPMLNGRKLSERLRQTRPALKVLFMSGYTADALGPHGVLAPGLELIQKPLNAVTLLARVREVLDRT